jgi:mannose-6-phosphate isomerase-like protein (cupin superfamily)
VVILEGEGIITLGSITKEIRAGDIIFIPADTFHEVNVTSEKPMKVISIQAPEFDGTDRILYKKN